MNKNSTVLNWQTLHYLNIGNINSDVEYWKRKYFDATIQSKLVDSLSPSKVPIKEKETYVDYTKGEEPAMPKSNDFECYDK